MDKHYCKAARDCGCTLWDYGKVSPVCAEIHCLDYVLPKPITNADPIRAAGGWISVKERLPEELTEVMVFTDATEQGVCMAFLENGKWLDGYSGRGIVLMQQELVTHWMPLPEPPKEDTHD